VIAYLDSSALVKLFIDEPGSDIARGVWESGALLATNRIAHAELACALGTAVRADRYEPRAVDPGVIDGTFLSERADLIEADAVVVDLAAVVGVRHGIRGMDAIHVASAMQLVEFGSTLVSWDERQRAAALAEGLPVYPETTTAALR
jgi:predicted nucleic acid-binding protein